MITTPRPRAPRAAAESIAAAVVALCAAYVVFNEGFANWQSVSFCGGLIGLSVILIEARDAPDRG